MRCRASAQLGLESLQKTELRGGHLVSELAPTFRRFERVWVRMTADFKSA